MKKLCVIFLAFVICLSSTVFAADIDLSSLSVEDLITLESSVKEELFLRGNKVELSEGEYVVGRDIAAGSYKITPCLYSSENEGYYEIYIFKYENARNDMRAAYDEYYATKDTDNPKTYTEADYLLSDKLMDPSESYSFSITDGQLLIVNTSFFGEDESTKLIIEKSTGLFME